jgi:hypothetical protein
MNIASSTNPEMRFEALPSSAKIDPPLSLGNLSNGVATDDSLLRTEYNQYAGMKGLRCAAIPDTRTHKQIKHKAPKRIYTATIIPSFPLSCLTRMRRVTRILLF